MNPQDMARMIAELDAEGRRFVLVVLLGEVKRMQDKERARKHRPTLQLVKTKPDDVR